MVTLTDFIAYGGIALVALIVFASARIQRRVLGYRVWHNLQVEFYDEGVQFCQTMFEQWESDFKAGDRAAWKRFEVSTEEFVPRCCKPESP